MKLGETLVRDARITMDQLAEAMAAQARDGGRLGSVLVELGFIDAETLTVYLGLELGIPIATGATLERCKRSAVRLLKPDQAARYRVIPIVIQGQTLIVAMDDPHDLVALDALSMLTGYRVIPRVAPEIRIFFYLERFYGIPRPPRFAKLADGPRGSKRKKPQHRDLPAPPLPGLPPRHESPVAAPTAVLRLREAPPPPPRAAAQEQQHADVAAADKRAKYAPPAPNGSGGANVHGHNGNGNGNGANGNGNGNRAGIGEQHSDEEHMALETDADDLVVALDEDDAEVAEEAERNSQRASSTTPPPVTGSPETRPARMTIEQANAAMNVAEQRGQVADAMLGWASGLFEVAAVMLVRDGMAYGWKGFGPELDRDRIETLLIPLEAPSIFQIALHSDHLFRGRAFPATLHTHLFKVLRCAQPHSSLVTVIAIGHRIVNLFYAHKRAGVDTTEDDVTALRNLTEAASEAYVRLISVTKKKRGETDQPVSEL